ncbi:methylenetetrahydrofolate reductase C-terminal domain-containing protein [Thermococcus henrietii]|uniref:methylenetetrahydrofolate reductase C-terminal domain-containing protein n=1 Tax=Thermococcus henrietii TaxID=2016361 RepID=UPI001CB78B58|nr:methylenetetrahydrofolate reductase C-terminal domain-containing protein [Thermococcus henrietii]
MAIRVYSCPKRLLNGPCGGALEGACEVDGRHCPWTGLIERVPLEPWMLFEEHPLLAELEGLVESDSVPRSSAFWRKLTRGKAFTVEFPVKVVRSSEDLLRVLRTLEADLVTVPDNPLGYPHFDPVAFATRLKDVGVRAGVMPHVTAKDRNLSALASELRTAQLFGFEAVLLTTGDWPGLSMPSRPVFDLDSPNLLRLARLVFAGVMPPGQRVQVESRPRVAGTMNPHYRPGVEARRTIRKIVAGAEVLFTQVVARRESVLSIREVLMEVEEKTRAEVPVVVSLLYPLGDELKPFLERMGIPTGDEGFGELLEEVKSLDAKGGVNLILLAETLGEWLSLWEEVKELVREVFG